MIKVMIVDDEKLIRKALQKMLEEAEGIEVIGEASDGFELIEVLESNTEIDVLLLDIKMPNIDGIETARILREKGFKGKILLLTTFNDVDYISKSLRYEISGYLLKSGNIDLIVENIKKVYEGELVFDTPALHNILNLAQGRTSDNQDKLEILTEKENEIANLIVSGLSNKEIANKLFISEGTVKNEISNIYKKLNIHKRTMLHKFIRSDR